MSDKGRAWTKRKLNNCYLQPCMLDINNDNGGDAG